MHGEVNALGVGAVEGHKAVGADAEASVAEACNLVGGELVLAGAVVDDDEVVAGAVEFIELKGHRLAFDVGEEAA